MSNYFNYDVDSETHRACLGIVARAAERVARGLPAVVATIAHRGQAQMHVRRAMKRLERPRVNRGELEALWAQGKKQTEIAAQLGCGLSTVKLYTANFAKGKVAA